MSLKYDSFSDVKIEEESTSNNLRKSLNISLGRLLQNDNELNPQNGISPKIWRCEWYNEPNSEKLSTLYGYDKGAAVWINTEDETEFINQRYDEISSILIQNSEFCYELKKNQNNHEKCFEMFRQAVNGTRSGGPNGEPLYFLGTLSDRIQIKVSARDNNIDTPDVSSSWIDFFDYDISSKNDIRLSNCIFECISTVIENHLQDYHMKGCDESTVKQYLEQNCTKRDLSNNISSIQTQKYTTHKDKKLLLRGFDFVKNFEVNRGTDGKSLVWYRLWNSGYLEQGGILKNGQLSAKDYSVSGVPINYLQITLPVSYNYITSNSKSFYELRNLQSDYKLLASDNRYQICVQPIYDDGIVPYSSLNGTYYCCSDVAFIKNDSFCLTKNTGCTYYSFKTQGFVQN